ncbi:hypothetical protein BSKO_11591 [Bryopsis sp. KO-2023]|nr:hypothetical protein BSKO_05981 [Bryopsis sp. KO-2023]GMH43669.1 hypothetical protein BSKO_11591 [Bryopsis sp. KO-2023]
MYPGLIRVAPSSFGGEKLDQHQLRPNSGFEFFDSPSIGFGFGGSPNNGFGFFGSPNIGFGFGGSPSSRFGIFGSPNIGFGFFGSPCNWFGFGSSPSIGIGFFGSLDNRFGLGSSPTIGFGFFGSLGNRFGLGSSPSIGFGFFGSLGNRFGLGSSPSIGFGFFGSPNIGFGFFGSPCNWFGFGSSPNIGIGFFGSLDNRFGLGSSPTIGFGFFGSLGSRFGLGSSPTIGFGFFGSLGSRFGLGSSPTIGFGFFGSLGNRFGLGSSPSIGFGFFGSLGNRFGLGSSPSIGFGFGRSPHNRFGFGNEGPYKGRRNNREFLYPHDLNIVTEIDLENFLPPSTKWIEAPDHFTPQNLGTEILRAFTVADDAEVYGFLPTKELLTVRSLKTTRGGGWLNDTVIDYGGSWNLMVLLGVSLPDQQLDLPRRQHREWPHCMFPEYLDSPDGHLDRAARAGPDITAMSCALSKLVMDDGVDRASSWMDHHSISSKSLLLIPLNQKNKHWILFALKPKEALGFFIDSARHTDREFMDNVIDAMLDFCPLLNKEKEWVFRSLDEARIQDDAWSCGVFVCWFGDRLASGKPLVPCTTDNLSALRGQLALDMVRESWGKRVNE